MLSCCQVLAEPIWRSPLDEDAHIIGIDTESEPDSDWPESAATAADLARLVNCCPALQECHLCIAEDLSLAPLAQLPALCTLDIQCVSDLSVHTLPALTQLHYLSIKMNELVTPANMVALTA